MINTYTFCVNWNVSIGVDNDAEEAGVGVDQACVISLCEVVKNSRFVQPGEVCHVLFFVEFGRVNSVVRLGFDFFARANKFHNAISARVFLEHLAE